ncbi:MAG: DUF2177 family protein [Acidobacteriota bacterium]
MSPSNESLPATAKVSWGLIARVAAGSTLTMLAMDAVWLSQVASGMYREELGDLMRSSTRWSAAVAFYIVYVTGIVTLAVLPALERATGRGELPRWAAAGRSGALLGFVAYGTFGFTSLAVLEPWTLSLVLIDLAWGIVLTGTAAAVGVLAAGSSQGLPAP